MNFNYTCSVNKCTGMFTSKMLILCSNEIMKVDDTYGLQYSFTETNISNAFLLVPI